MISCSLPFYYWRECEIFYLLKSSGAATRLTEASRKLNPSFAMTAATSPPNPPDLMDWIEAHGEADRTIILFMSDNGGFSCGSKWRGGTLHTHNALLKSGKGSAYEDRIREPMIVS